MVRTRRATTAPRAGRAARAIAAAAAGVLIVAACASDDDPASDQTTTAPDASVADTADPETRATTTTPSTTTLSTTTLSTTGGSDAGEDPADTSSADVQVLDFEFQPVPAGRYRVETIGAPFLIDVPDGWFVQPNSFGHFVLTDPESMGPGDRDIVMIRPSNLADPARPGAPVEEQGDGWPVDDIDGWLEALIPGVVDGEGVETAIGGLDAVEFDVAVGDDVECGEGFCVGFATNREVNSMWFDPGIGYRVWWIDGGDQSPIAINIGDGSDPEFTERARAVLDTVVFESIGPNPIPSEGNLWELGFPSEVPAGEVMLPVGPGVEFAMSERHFIVQGDHFSGILLNGPGEVDIFFPDLAFDGATVATVDDVIEAIDRDPDLTGTVGGTRDVDGYEATEIELSSQSQPGGDGPPPPKLTRTGVPKGEGWRAPPDGVLWVMETPDGLAAITAEWFEATAEQDARSLAGEVLDSITIGS